MKRPQPRANLNWLFADWIDADHGLPDFTIDKVFPNAVQSGNWLVSVTISNAGYAAAEVPVTVRSATNTTTERVFVPARGTVTPRILVQGKPTEVQVNDGTVPETQASVHITASRPEAGTQPNSHRAAVAVNQASERALDSSTGLAVSIQSLMRGPATRSVR